MIVDTSGLDRLMARLRRIESPNATLLMKRWDDIILQDNRKGVLAGLDKDGVPLIPVTYRPKPPGPLKPTKAQRGGRRANAYQGAHNPGIGGNLTHAEYQLLDGPPLAPRGQFSRVITNLQPGFAPNPAILRVGQPVEAFCAWEAVVSRRNFHFLPVHFEGLPLGRHGPSKRRDLRGVRPEGIQKALTALRAWAIDQVRQHG